jgi:type I restriction enzyme S subunit
MAKHAKSTVTPRLRFPEFRKAVWNHATLGQLFLEREEAGFTDLPLLSLMDKEGIVPQEETNRKNNSSADKSKYLRVVPGDIAYNTMRMWEGRSAYATIEGLISPAYTVCVPAKKTNSLFFSYYFKSDPIVRQFRRYSQGLVKDTLNLKYEAFSRIELTYPAKISEQRKIADCLTSLDEVISAQGRKVEALKAHKRGLMQQLFPREGESVPRLRFSEFRDGPGWRRMPLGEIAEIKLGKMLDGNKHTSGRLLPYINNISLQWNDVDTSDLPQMYFNERELERYGLQAGDVLVCEGGEPGRSAVWDGRLPHLKFQKAIHRVRFHVLFVPKILVLYLEAIAGTTAFESLFTGGGIKHLTRETFAKLTIPVMPFPEQQRIAGCLSSLDAQIAAESNRLAALKTHKQGLMQQLFPSPAEASA